MSEQSEDKDKKILIIGGGGDSISSAIVKAMIKEQEKFEGINIKDTGNDNHCWWQQYERKKPKY